MNEDNIVADASAILAALKNEPFSNVDPRLLVGATISAVNVCEVLAKLHDDGLNKAQAQAAVSAKWICVSSPLTDCRRACGPIALEPGMPAYHSAIALA